LNYTSHTCPVPRFAPRALDRARYPRLPTVPAFLTITKHSHNHIRVSVAVKRNRREKKKRKPKTKFVVTQGIRKRKGASLGLWEGVEVVVVYTICDASWSILCDHPAPGHGRKLHRKCA